MARTEIGKYLATDTRVCGGRLIFKGTRILVSDALELARAGYTTEAVAEQYLVLITTPVLEIARSIRRVLRHPAFGTKALRCAKVLKLSATIIAFWEANRERQQLEW